jgi:hypothetical protein
MGIDVLLIDERGNVQSEVFDLRNCLGRLLPAVPNYEGTHCIQHVDPYGDTIFNTMQIERFLVEWRLVEELATHPEEKNQLADIRALALRCRDSAHLYLKFLGD